MITAPEKKQYPIPDEGRYLLKVSKLADKVAMTQWGERTKIVFTFDVMGTDNGEGHPMRVFTQFYKSLGKVTKPSYLAKFIEKIMGRKLAPEDFKAFDESTLLSKTIDGEITHNTDTDGRTWANVDEFYKNRPGGAPPVAEPKDEEVPF